MRCDYFYKNRQKIQQKVHNGHIMKENLRNKGIISIIISSFCFCIMFVCVKMSGELPVYEKAFFRNFIAAILVFVILKKNGEKLKIGKGNFKFLLLRSTCGTAGIICNFYAVDHMLLSDANVLMKLSPFFAILFSYFILKERINASQFIIVVGAFLGMLLVIKPTGSTFAQLLPSLIGVMGGLSAGAAYTFVRLLGKRKENGNLIVFFFSCFSCLILLPFMIFNFVPMTGIQLFYLILAGMAACGGQIMVTRAYTYAPAGEISVYDYTQVIFSSIFGYLFFGQIPDSYSVLGYFVIMGMAVLMFFLRKRKSGEAAENVSS